MRFHQLLYFLETARHEHIGRAAKILAISPSAISHSIASLEDELGRQLFVKQGKYISLTSHGKLLFERVSKLLNNIEEIKEEIMSDQVELQGTYKLAGSHLLAPALLAPAWFKVQNLNAKLVGEVYTLRSSLVLQGVSSGEYDLGICFNPQSHPSVGVKVLYEGDLVVAVRPGHPLLKSKRKDQMAALSSLPATLPKSYQGIDNCETHPVFEKFSIVPTTQLMFDNYEIAVEKIKRSDAWGLLPDWIVEREGLEALVPEGWSAPVNISVLWPKNRIVNRVLRKMIETLEGEFTKDAPSSGASAHRPAAHRPSQSELATGSAPS